MRWAAFFLRTNPQLRRAKPSCMKSTRYPVRSVQLFFSSFLFFFNDTATTEIYTLSLHDALPIRPSVKRCPPAATHTGSRASWPDRKSTRLNSSHMSISYAVFCLKKKNKTHIQFFYAKKKKKQKITDH